MQHAIGENIEGASVIFVKTNRILYHNFDLTLFRINFDRKGLKAYWINLDDRVQRRSFMENQLNDVGLNHKRISAITPSSPRFNITVLEKPCKRNTNKDLAVILSHMVSIREAINDLDGDASYALILEVNHLHSIYQKHKT
jgi:hypothetical protein